MQLQVGFFLSNVIFGRKIIIQAKDRGWIYYKMCLRADLLSSSSMIVQR